MEMQRCYGGVIKKVLIVLGVLVVLGVIGNLVEEKTPTEPKVTKEAEVIKETDISRQVETAESEKPKQPTRQYFEVKEAVRVGNFEWTVSGWGATGTYINILLWAKNVGMETESLSQEMVSLTDTQGRTFKMYSDGEMFWHLVELFGEINPGITKRLELTFEVPADNKYFVKVTNGNMLSPKYALILLSE